MELYVFSATGNTLSTARLLAEALGGDVKLLPMPALLGREVIASTDNAVGFLFPVYSGDMPYIVRDTLARMTFTGAPYIFGMATYRGNMGPSALRLNAVLEQKGQRLSHFDGIPMPGNSRLSRPEAAAEALARQPERVREAAEKIKARVTEDYSGQELPAPSPYTEGYANVRGMKADETCIGCGTCVRVCPMGNITLVEKHAEMGERCLTCLACFHWCPKEAVYMSQAEEKMMRRAKYRHPDVKLPDMLAQKKL